MRKAWSAMSRGFALVKGKPKENAMKNQEEKIAEYFNLKVEAKDKQLYSKQFVEKYINFLSNSYQMCDQRINHFPNFIDANQNLKIGQYTKLMIAKHYQKITPQAQTVIDNFTSLCMKSLAYKQAKNENKKAKPNKNVLQVFATINNLFLLMSESTELYLQFLMCISQSKMAGHMFLGDAITNYRVCMENLVKKPPSAFNQNNIVRIIYSMSNINIHYTFHQRSSEIIMHFYKMLDSNWHKNFRFRRSLIGSFTILGCYSQDINKKFKLIVLDPQGDKQTKLYAFNGLIKHGYINSTNYNTTEKQLYNSLAREFNDKDQMQFFHRHLFMSMYRAQLWIPQFWVPFFENFQKLDKYGIDIYQIFLLDKLLEIQKQEVPSQIIKAAEVLKKYINMKQQNVNMEEMMKNYLSKQVNNKNLNCQVQIANALRLTNIGSVRTEVLIDMFMVDILINNKFVVQVNGSTHYLTDLETGQRTYNLKTMFRTKFLKKLGYTVIDITLQNFNEGSFEIIGQVYRIVNDPKNQGQPKSFIF